MRAEPALQRLAQRREFAAQLPARQSLRSSPDPSRHPPTPSPSRGPAEPHDVGQDRGQLETRFLEDPLQSIHLTGAFLDLLLPISGEITQVANRRLRYKTTAQQPILQQLGESTRILARPISDQAHASGAAALTNNTVNPSSNT